MLVKNCVGALTFWDNKVFLLKDERGEWIFPKTIIKTDEISVDAALRALKNNAGITAEIISTVGHVTYEVSSKRNYQPIYNKIIWYVMISQDYEYLINDEKGFTEGGYFSLEEAMELITHNNHKAVLNLLSKEVLGLVSELITA